MRAGIVGVGFMGWIHYLAYGRSESAEMVAFCSRDEGKRGGDWSSIRGNFGPPGEEIDVSGLQVHETLEQLLEDPDVDLVDICLPPHLHADAIEKSLRAGKKVLCEKPLALDAANARRLAELARPGQLLVAHILPFMPEFRLLVEAAADRRWGRPLAGRFKRTIGPPDWIPDFYDRQRVGGPLIDLHVHDAHLIRILFGMPTAAHTAAFRKEGIPKFYETVFEYPGQELAVSAGGGVIDSPARPFTHGYEVSFEQATVQYESAAYADGSSAMIPVTILHNDGRVERPELGGGDAVESFAAEIDAAVKSFTDGSIDPILDAATAADAIEICEMQSR